jgi:hypothetical protein
MATLRTVFSALMSKGVLSRGWYSILTGVAMVYVAYGLYSVAEDDAAAPFVAVVLAVAGAWQLERGLRAEFQRRPKSTDQDS